MPVLIRGFLKRSLIMLFIAIFVSIPEISIASSPNLGRSQTVVVKDIKSGAVVLKKHGAYFYGLFRGKKIINTDQIVPREFIVKYKDVSRIQDQSPIRSTVLKFNAKTKELNRKWGLTLVQLPKDQSYFKIMQELSKNPNIKYVEPNYIVKAQSIPNDPFYAFQWGPRIIKAESAWEKVDLSKREKIKIAIIDSGVNSSHEDLKDSITPGYDFVNNDYNTSDDLGHGTHVAGIAAGLADNGAGIAGIASGCKIMPVKVLGKDGIGSEANIVEGIKYATDHGAQVINMSLGGPGSSDAIQDAIDYATVHGVNVVVAAGNENGPIDTPGNCRGVITVGAIDNSGKKASYSNFGPKLDVVAPGSDILSTYIGGSGPSGYAYLSGTSMATPFVSGIVALVKAANPDLSPAEIINIIHQSAEDLGELGFDNSYGFGLVNTDKAVDLALTFMKTDQKRLA